MRIGESVVGVKWRSGDLTGETLVGTLLKSGMRETRGGLIVTKRLKKEKKTTNKRTRSWDSTTQVSDPRLFILAGSELEGSSMFP